MGVDFEILAERARAGTLSAEEASLVATELQKENPSTDRYHLLYILGKGLAKSYEELVAQFLDSPNEPMLARIALITLCDYWGNTETYLDRVRQFVEGVDWDLDNDCRLVAISTGGEYLRKHSNPQLLKLIVDTFQDEAEDNIVRQAAYSAIARAVGKEWKEIPSAARDMDFNTQVDPIVLHEARNRIASETG